MGLWDGCGISWTTCKQSALTTDNHINTSSLNFYRPDALSFQVLNMPWPCVGLSQVRSTKKAELISWVLAWELPSTCATMCYKEVWVS